MKMADILRNLADKLDGIEQGGETDRPANTGPTSDHFQHDIDDGAKSGDTDVEVTSVMVPPLQAKLELLKKATGIDNVYDSNELGDIKKLTGIQAVIGLEAGEDNDITG